jgi:hypothetical protein
MAVETAGGCGVVCGPTTLLLAEPVPARSFAVGTKVSALAGFDQTYHPADVVDVRRPAKSLSRSTKVGQAIVEALEAGEASKNDGNAAAAADDDGDNNDDAAVDEPDPADVSYYVHYHGFDKRLDEWLPGTKLEPFTAAVGGGGTGGAGLVHGLGSGAGLSAGGGVGLHNPGGGAASDGVSGGVASGMKEVGSGGGGGGGSGLTVSPRDGGAAGVGVGTPGGAGAGAGVGAGSGPDTGGRKLTRNLKRRYNEINNVGADPEVGHMWIMV